MDAGTSAAAAAVVSELSTSRQVHTKLLACVRGRCSNLLRNAWAKAARATSVRRCAARERNAGAEAVMASARERGGHTSSARPALLRQCGGDAAADTSRRADRCRCRSEEGRWRLWHGGFRKAQGECARVPGPCACARGQDELFGDDDADAVAAKPRCDPPRSCSLSHLGIRVTAAIRRGGR